MTSGMVAATGRMPIGPAMVPQRYAFTYTAGFDVPKSIDGTVTVYIPVAGDSDAQTVESFDLKPEMGGAHLVSWSIKREAEYGNHFVEAVVENPGPDTELQLDYVITRREVVNPPEGAMPSTVALPAPAPRFLEPDQLVPLTGPIQALAQETLAGATTQDMKIRAIYDKTVQMMRYDKSGTGWGRGDVVWACDNKRGNCTDFHSVVIGMARVSGMPAKFEIGFPIPVEQTAGTISGYHCWAFLFHPTRGWVPIDASEGWKNNRKYKDYYLGRIGTDRIAMSVGRDLKLGQQGPPLNYFLTPYAEQGKTEIPTKLTASFKKLPLGE
jgi:transglutaminase-like putative cysteine protease